MTMHMLVRSIISVGVVLTFIPRASSSPHSSHLLQVTSPKPWPASCVSPSPPTSATC